MIARLLMEHGADVNARSKSGFTPLMFAARFGDVEAGRLLLARGAGVNDANAEGVTVLMVAVLRDHAEFAQFLLDQGADPRVDKAGYTALHWAAGRWESSMTHDYPHAAEGEWRYLGGMTRGRLEIIKALVAHGADVNARIKKSPPRYGINLFGRITLTAATPFFLAAHSADVETMRLLVSLGADTKLATNDNVTPLMAAAGLGRIPGDSLIEESAALAATRLCVELGNDLNTASTLGDTALHGTAYYGHDTIAEYLVKQGADMNVKNKKGETPLKVADGYIQAAMVLSRPSTAKVLRALGATY
jgi:ankyrin repeat protein